MKNIYLLGISISISLAILYLLWQQKKRLEELQMITRSIQPIPLENVLDKEMFISETRNLHSKIENSYEKVHQQYLEVIASIDNIPIIGSQDYSGEELSENIRSYHGENLIDIDEPKNQSLEINLEEPIPQSILGIGEKTNGSISLTSKISSNNKKIVSAEKNNSEPIVENEISSEQQAVSYSISSKVPKLTELRNYCKNYGLSTYGNKKELLERLKKVGVNF